MFICAFVTSFVFTHEYTEAYLYTVAGMWYDINIWKSLGIWWGLESVHPEWEELPGILQSVQWLIVCHIGILFACYVWLQANDKEEIMKRISHQFKLIMHPYYKGGTITKDEYKDIMRKAVPAVRIFNLFLHVMCRHDLYCTESDVNKLSDNVWQLYRCGVNTTADFTAWM